MRKLTMALMVGSTLALAVPAFAADVVEEQVYDWSGLYAGVFAGVGYTSSDWDGTDDDVAVEPNDIDTSLNDTAFLLGGLVGVNLQQENLVFGLEGDIAWFHSDKDKQPKASTSSPRLIGWAHCAAGWDGLMTAPCFT